MSDVIHTVILVLPPLFVACMMYFLPFLIAAQRHHRNRTAIGLTNLLFGWTLMGWLITLIWAFTDNVETRSRPREK